MVAADWICIEGVETFRTQIETLLPCSFVRCSFSATTQHVELIQVPVRYVVVVYRFVLLIGFKERDGIVFLFKRLMNFEQIVSVVVGFTIINIWLDYGVRFDADFKAHFMLWVDHTAAAITGMVDHKPT